MKKVIVTVIVCSIIASALFVTKKCFIGSYGFEKNNVKWLADGFKKVTYYKNCHHIEFRCIVDESVLKIWTDKLGLEKVAKDVGAIISTQNIGQKYSLPRAILIDDSIEKLQDAIVLKEGLTLMNVEEDGGGWVVIYDQLKGELFGNWSTH